jgi:hypothetical protein
MTIAGVIIVLGAGFGLWPTIAIIQRDPATPFRCLVNSSGDYDSGCGNEGDCWNTATVVININGTLYIVPKSKCGANNACSQVYAPGAWAACWWEDGVLGVSYDQDAAKVEASTSRVGWIFLAVIVGCVGLVVLGFTVYHMYLLYTGQTQPAYATIS